MKKAPVAPSSGDDVSRLALRRQAEARLVQSPDLPASLSSDESRDTLHELRVHQIELEMQNEELRRAQTEIEAGRARYFDLYDLAPVGYCTLSEQGLILEANLTAATLLGTARSALVSRPITRFIIKDDQDRYYLHRKKLFQTGDPQQSELRLVRPDGVVFWAHLTATAAQTEDGATVCRVALSDITERKRAETVLRESEEKFATAFQTSPYAITITRARDGRFVEVNDAFTTMTGFTREEALAESSIGLQLWRNTEDRDQVVSDLRAGRTVVGRECLFRMKHDKPFVGSFSARAILLGGEQCVLSSIEDITERQRGADALRSSRQLLAATEALSAVGGWEWDVATQAMAWTEGTYRIHDLDSGAVPAGSPAHIERSLACYDPGDRPRVEKAFRHCLETGEAYDLECGFTTARGRRLRVRTMGRAIGEGGRTVKVMGNLQDITEQKRAKEELARSAALLRDVVDMVPDYICAKNSEGRFLLVNRKLADFYGLPIDTMTGMLHADLCKDKEELRAMLAADRQVIESGRAEVIPEETMKKPDGSLTVLETYKIPFTADGKPAVLIASADITERKRAEEALRESEERIRAANDASLDALLLLRSERDDAGEVRDFIFVDLNRRTEALLRMDRGQLLGKRLCEVLPVNREVGFFAKYKRVVDTGIPLEEEFLLPETHVPAAWYYHQVVKVGDGIFICHRDIGERKRAEEEREKLQEQFLQAQKMQSVGRLAGGVAHDFNNLLMGIMGYVELCRDEVAPEHPIREWLDEIMYEAKRSADLVRQLLAFASKQAVLPKAVDLNEQIGGMLKMLGRLIGERIELTWSPAADLRIVSADPSHIDQVMANLCVNAADAITGNGHIAIATRNVVIDARASDGLPGMPPGAYVLLSVADTGCGMDADTQAHAFEPFFTTKDVGRGTGLGLATVYGIVKQSNGYITLDSAPGAGTTFSIYLPALDCPEMAAAPRAEAGPPPGGNETILVVDDERSVRVTTAARLDRLGYTVLMADGPEAALRLAREHAGAIDLLLSDMVMPGMSGVELQDRLLRARPGLKTLLITGYTTVEFVEPEGRGADTVRLTKPVPLRTLALAIRSLLDDRRPARPEDQ